MRISKRRRSVFVPLRIDEDSVWRLRPATSLDVEIARARVTRQLAGILAGSEQASRIAEVFGPEFSLGGDADPDRVAAVTALLGDVELACLCSDGWTGVEDDDGAAVPAPEPGAVAFLLADRALLARVRGVLYAALTEESAEKNVSAASPDGGAATDEGSAPTAAPAAAPAPTAA